MKDISEMKNSMISSTDDLLNKYKSNNDKPGLTHKIPDGQDYGFKPLAAYNPITKSYKVSYAGNLHRQCKADNEVTIGSPWGENPSKLTALYVHFDQEATGKLSVYLRRPVSVDTTKDFSVTAIELDKSFSASLINVDIWINPSKKPYNKGDVLVVRNETDQPCDIVADFVFE
jgi:hypothetical protein